MKAFFLCICLLNVAFFFWELNKSSVTPVDRKSNLPEILLASEVEKARGGEILSAYLDGDLEKLEHDGLFPPDQKLAIKAPVKKTSPAFAVARSPFQPPPTQAASGCYEFGPFADRNALSTWLESQGLTGEIFDRLAFIPASFMVYYPADTSPDQLRLQKMMLAAKGLKDFWVVPSGEFKGMLSLGVFNDIVRAEYMKNNLSRIGVKTEIAERKKSESSLFVRVRTAKQIQGQFGGMTAVGCKIAKNIKK